MTPGQRTQPEEGDVVTFLDVHETCGSYYHCLVVDQPNRCPSRKVYGIPYCANDGLLGGWSKAIYMKPGVPMTTLVCVSVAPLSLSARAIPKSVTIA